MFPNKYLDLYGKKKESIFRFPINKNSQFYRSSILCFLVDNRYKIL